MFIFFAYELCVVCFLLQGDYRQLVHELDQYQYCELRLVIQDIRNTYVRHPHPVITVKLYFIYENGSELYKNFQTHKLTMTSLLHK